MQLKSLLLAAFVFGSGLWSVHGQQNITVAPAPCKDLTGDLLQIRAWQLQNQTLNSTVVLNQFRTDFVPGVVNQSGFQQIVGAAPNNTHLILWDVFSNQTANQTSNQTVSGGQQQQPLGIARADQFVSSASNLSGLQPVVLAGGVQILNGTIGFDYLNASLCRSPDLIAHNNTFMALRIYDLLPNATLSNQQVLTAFNSTFVRDLMNTTGFREFLGAADQANHTIFIDFFDTFNQATQSNDASRQFVQGSNLADNVRLASSSVSPVVFDAFNRSSIGVNQTTTAGGM